MTPFDDFQYLADFYSTLLFSMKNNKFDQNSIFLSTLESELSLQLSVFEIPLVKLRAHLTDSDFLNILSKYFIILKFLFLCHSYPCSLNVDKTQPASCLAHSNGAVR